jgi:signal transduction histidine kinase
LVEQHLQAAAEEGRRAAAEDLVTLLAHDLHTLLSPISLRLQALRRRFEAERRATDSDEIQRVLDGMARLQGLIVHLLDTARLERGMFDLEIQDCDLAALARETSMILSPTTTPIAVQADEPVPIRADPVQLHQAIENLLSKVLQHSPQAGSVSVTVESERQDTGGGARLVVRDQGPGIPQELLPRLSERYVKGAHSQGLGLGLYSAQRIVQAHKGSLTVESTSGKGAQFTMRLPLRADGT